MEYTVTANTNSPSAEVDLVYSFTDINNAFEKAYQRAAHKVKVNGFRQGKAPIDMVKKMLGESVTEDAISGLLNESISELSSKLDFTPYRFPKIEIVKFERNAVLNAKALFEKAPEVLLADYKSIEAKKFNLVITDEDLAPELENLQKKLSKTASKEEGEVAENKDLLEIDIKTFEGENELNSSENQMYEIGMSEAQKRIDDNLLGMKVGDEKTFDFLYGEEAGPALAGKNYTFKVKVNSLSKIILPELDDNLALEWDGTETLELLKQKMREDISKNVEAELKQRMFAEILSKIKKASTFTIPPSLIDDERNGILDRIKNQAKAPALTLETYSEALNQDVETTKANLDKQAVNNIQNFLSIHKISAAEGLTITAEEINGVYESVIKGLKTVPSGDWKRNILSSIHNNLTQTKVEDFFVGAAKPSSTEEISLAKATTILNSPLEEI